MRALVLALAALPFLAAHAQDAKKPAAPAVVIKRLAQVALHPEREASAQAISLNESRIAAELAGRIIAIPVRARSSSLSLQSSCESTPPRVTP